MDHGGLIDQLYDHTAMTTPSRGDKQIHHDTAHVQTPKRLVLSTGSCPLDVLSKAVGSRTTESRATTTSRIQSSTTNEEHVFSNAERSTAVDRTAQSTSRKRKASPISGKQDDQSALFVSTSRLAFSREPEMPQFTKITHRVYPRRGRIQRCKNPRRRHESYESRIAEIDNNEESDNDWVPARGGYKKESKRQKKSEK